MRSHTSFRTVLYEPMPRGVVAPYLPFALELRHVAELRDVDDAARSRRRLFDAVRTTEQPKVLCDEVSIARLEVDLAKAGEQAAVSSGQPHDVGHLSGPFDGKRRNAGQWPFAFTRRRTSHIHETRVRLRVLGYARICRGSAPLRPALAFAFRHRTIYARRRRLVCPP